MLKKLWQFTKNYKRFLLVCPLLMIGEVLMETLIPLLMGKIVDVGIAESNLGYVLKTGGLMMLMSLCSLAFGAGAARFSAVGGAGFAKQLRKALFDKVQTFSFYNIDRFSTASLVTRMTTDVNNAQNMVMLCSRMLFRAPFMLVIATILAARINGELVMIFFVAVPVLAVTIGFAMSKAHPRFTAMLKKYDALNASVQENLIAIRVVKAFVRSDYEKEKFDKSVDDVREMQLKAEKLIVVMMPIMQMIVYLCICAVLWFGGNKIVQGTMLTGELISFISYVTQILMSLMMLSMLLLNLVLSRASIGRIVEVLDEVPDIQNGANALDTIPDGSIDFDDVYFSYKKGSENYILSDVNLHIKPGETIGILGGTGSAKSTLVQLIPRLYDVSRGSVRVGGHDVREYDVEALRDAVAMVLQKNVLFSGTIRDNLRWGDKDATQEEIEAACRAAQAHDFIMSFPNGYDTDLGQGGVNVSGGQKQRLCIARALLKHPKVVILDDSTSAVDTATDASIRRALHEEFSHITTLIIAQRVASVMDADKIIILDEGRIADMGTHDELMARSAIYREIYTSQMKGAEA
ncbi:MAG: ABC transporter ATP-binding protein [Candidatus Aphodomonas sp.]|nr:ABC transporter ATP-binding protein [Candidatus Aphodomonas sp.]